jgi:hypothetical protein
MNALRAQQRLVVPPCADAPPPASAPLEGMNVAVDDGFEISEEVVLEEGRITREDVEEVRLLPERGGVSNRDQLILHLLRLPVVGRKLKLIIDVATRWNSSFYMAERLLVLRPFIVAVSALYADYLKAPLQYPDGEAPEQEREPLVLLNESDWRVLEDFWRVLFHVAELTTMSQAEKYPSLGQVHMYLKFLYNDILIPASREHELAEIATQDGRNVLFFSSFNFYFYLKY